MLKSELINISIEVINIIVSYGHEAFLVGGSLRDSLFSINPKDIDIATSALPLEIKNIFKDYHTIDTGIVYGTVTLIYKNNPIEITTFRTDESYNDNRHPQNVKFNKSLNEDLSRRDFTINAMAYNPKVGIVDLFNGQEDLKSKIIRCVNEPNERFQEDALRMLRAVRLACIMGFEIEKKTNQAIINNSSIINKVSNERIQVELSKILLSKEPSRGIRLLNETKLLDYILPEIKAQVGFNQKNKYHNLELFDHTLCVLDKTSSILELRLAALLHDVGKVDTFSIDDLGEGHFYGHEKSSANIAMEVLKRLKFSNEIINLTYNLVCYHMIQEETIGKRGIQKLLIVFGDKDIFNLVSLHEADSSCTNIKNNKDCLRAKINKALEDKMPFSIKNLDITGHDIMNLGANGKEVGVILNKLLENVAEDISLNSKEKLIKLAIDLFKEFNK